jgi:4-amino-4-deoxy-L-arabinose transferase-like glycosyltransferase
MGKNKIKKALVNNWPILLIWIIALFLRCYRQSDLLGFYYDQGRDAKMAADIISFKNFPAIGPTTGISGLFLGPLWYYLISPGYALAGGNPATASYFMAFLESLTIPLIFYFVSVAYRRRDTAYLAAIIWAFSVSLIRSSRWFSNPTPLPTFVLLIMIFTYFCFQKRRYQYLPLIALCLGVSIQLEAASAIFFFPVLLIVLVLNFKKLKEIKLAHWFKSILAFGVLLLPQAAFEIKNHFLVSRNFIGFLTGKVNSDTGRSWAIPTLEFLSKRLPAYYQSFFSKLDVNVTAYSWVFLVIFLIGLIFLIKKLSGNFFLRLQFIWLFVPLFLLLFFIGNYGTLYDYYLTGSFPAFIILFAVVLTPEIKFLKYFLITLFTLYFFTGNYLSLKNYLTNGIDGPNNVVFGNELAAVDYACRQNQLVLGNFDVYVPPVIAHAYEYLIAWRQSQHRCFQFDSHRNSRLYVIYEVDPPHPERLKNWLAKYQADKLLEEKQFGGVRVQTYLRQH